MGKTSLGILLLVYEVIPHITGWDVIPLYVPETFQRALFIIAEMEKKPPTSPRKILPFFSNLGRLGRHCILAPENDNPRG